jgi:radical SAM superfamily enzyme YgiQ (UPF0313 family)
MSQQHLVLVNPAFFDGDEFRNRFEAYLEWIKGGNLYVAPFEPPLGLAYLAAALKASGHRVSLLDMQGSIMDGEALARNLAELAPDIVGVTAMTTTLPDALKVADVAHRVSPSVHVVLGGVHPTLDPASALDHPSVDFVVRGEGERALPELIEALQGRRELDSVDGLCYRRDGELCIKPKAAPILDLDSLPMADYDAFPVGRYIEHNAYLRGMRGISMLMSRGCPYQCTFCAVHETMGRKWRPRSARKIIDQIEDLRDRHGVQGIWFKDSIFNLNREWVREFCHLMIERKVGVSFQALTRVDLIREEELQLLVQAGLTQLDLGIEAGSEKSLARLKKGITPERIRAQVALAKKYVKVFGFFMIGIPGESEADIRETFDLAKDIELDRWTWSIYSPLPGSALFEDLVKGGVVDPRRLRYSEIHFTDAYEGVCNVAPARLKELYREINDYFCRRVPSAHAQGQLQAG